MKKIIKIQRSQVGKKTTSVFCAAILALAVCPASAFELALGDETKGSLDTSISYGTGWRTEDQAASKAGLYPNYAAAKADNHATVINKNDGDANFDNNSRPYTSIFTITSDLELKHSDYGLLLRGTAFYDDVIMNRGPNRSATNNFTNTGDCNPAVTASGQLGNCGFPSDIRGHSGTDTRLLDAYTYGNFNIADHPLNARLGYQVINWGESLFLQNGINSANPVAIAKLHLPGSEVKEALIPLPMAYGSFELTKGLTMESFLEFDWAHSEPDDAGTYYSGSDVGPGLGGSRILVNLGGNNWAANQRGADINGRKTGQLGVAFRYYAEALNNTEFGAYYMNYTNHTPVAQFTNGQFSGAAGMQSALNYLNSTTYNFIYPSDVHLYGLSFSTTAGDLAVAGEVAYRPNEPVLLELGENLVAYNGIYAGAVAAGLPQSMGAAFGPNLNNGQRAFPGQTIADYTRLATYNFEFVTTEDFGPAWGTNGLQGVLETGAEYIPSAGDRRYPSIASQINIPIDAIQYGAVTPLIISRACAGPKYEANTCLSEGGSWQYLSRFSWGYRLALSATYNDVFEATTLKPFLRFAHDVRGNSEITGNFEQDRKSATLGVNFLHNNNTEISIAYNAFWGAYLSNLLADRGNVTFSAKYSF